jgi:hypothetical protein
VLFAPDAVPTKPPLPPVTELPEPVREKLVTPLFAPNRVVAAAEDTVSFGAA